MNQGNDARRRVLLVDDDEKLAQVVPQGLELFGFQVKVTTRAETASDAVDEVPSLDAVVADLGATGVSWIESVRSRRPSLPILIISGGGVDEQALRDAGATSYLAKPFRLKELADAVKALIDGDLR